MLAGAVIVIPLSTLVVSGVASAKTKSGTGTVTCSTITGKVTLSPPLKTTGPFSLETETLKVLSTPDMKDKLFKAGFLVRPQGADAAWARVTKEIETFKRIIDQAGVQKL